MDKQNPAWCHGCGDFSILTTSKNVIEQDLKLETSSYVLVSGIGQAAKTTPLFW